MTEIDIFEMPLPERRIIIAGLLKVEGMARCLATASKWCYSDGYCAHTMYAHSLNSAIVRDLTPGEG